MFGIDHAPSLLAGGQVLKFPRLCGTSQRFSAIAMEVAHPAANLIGDRAVQGFHSLDFSRRGCAAGFQFRNHSFQAFLLRAKEAEQFFGHGQPSR